MALFTRDNAREMAVRGNLVRWTRYQESQKPRPPAASAAEVAEDGYNWQRLERVRVQLNQLDEAITRETAKRAPDGQRLNWLAQAQDRLAEQERILAGRPLPGSRRPAQERAPRRQTSEVLTPIPIPEPEPTMTQDQVHTPPMTQPTDSPAGGGGGAAAG